MKRKAAKSANNSWSSLRGGTNLEKGETEGVGRQRGEEEGEQDALHAPAAAVGPGGGGQAGIFSLKLISCSSCFRSTNQLFGPTPNISSFKESFKCQQLFLPEAEAEKFLPFFHTQLLHLSDLYLSCVGLPVHKHLAIH